MSKKHAGPIAMSMFIGLAVACGGVSAPEKAPVEPVATAVEPTPEPVAPRPAVNTGKWLASSAKSAFDDTRTEILGLDANSEVSGWPAKKHRPLLILRCQEKRTEVYIDIGMQAKPDYPQASINGSIVRIRFDDRPAQRIEATKSTDNTGLFLPNPVGLIREMLRSERMLFGFTPFNADPQATEFELVGLSEVIGPLQEACGWQTVSATARAAQTAAAERAGQEAATERAAQAAPNVLKRFEQGSLVREFGLTRAGDLDRFDGEAGQKYVVAGEPDAQVEVWVNESRVTSIGILGTGSAGLAAAVAKAKADLGL